ncbi:MAG: hypothetical protein ACYC0H_24230 [Solirubrobacteraceae bacterium]
MRPSLRRRPSPAIAISCVALFLSLGGVGYAATQLPHNSVGPYQLRNQAVTYRKIRPSAVGIVRANTNQLQVRVGGSCPAGSGIGSIDKAGKVTCNQSLPQHFGTTDNTAGNVGSTAATISSVALPAGATYLATANPTATVTPATGVADPQHVTVTCKLTVGSNVETRSTTIDTSAPTATGGTATQALASTGSIPMQMVGQAGTGSVSCTSALSPVAVASGKPQPAAPTVAITSSIDAIQVR